MSQEFEKASILKDANVTYSSQSGAALGSDPVPPAGDVEVAAYQYRERPCWDKARGFSPWQACDKGYHENLLRCPVLNDWEYETRALIECSIVTRLQAALDTLGYELAGVKHELLETQEDLTKARELLKEVADEDADKYVMGSSWHERLAHQSAPAAKADELPKDRDALIDLVMRAADAYWYADRNIGGPGAVKWIRDDETQALCIYTRGEYEERLRHFVMSLEGTMP